MEEKIEETTNDIKTKKELLKHLILQLHNNVAPEQVKKRLTEVLHSVPYDDVVSVEQELISEGLPAAEVLKLCDIHTAVLDGSIDTSGAKVAPEGHPVDTFSKENKALESHIKVLEAFLKNIDNTEDKDLEVYVLQLRSFFNELSDVDKHYLRKEYLLFPFLEKSGITGPPTVMWGKHDETRELLKAVREAIGGESILTKEELKSIISLAIEPAIEAVRGMIMKEEEILLPMAMDTLSEEDWWQIYNETPIYGFCLYDPKESWKPENISSLQVNYKSEDAITLSSGSFDMKELEALFVTIPLDITYVDKNDKVKFFSHSPNRVFERNRSIIGRDVRMCHPPQSVNIVEKIIDDFKNGRENKAAFWISNFRGRFVYIEYTALRSLDGEYLGVIETTQDITELRKLEGDQRLLSYSSKTK